MSQPFTVSLHRIGAGEHDENGRGDHLDWFFAVDDRAGASLVTWSTPICLPNTGENASRRLPDHRARYLGYDGEISGDRGWVQRLVTGRCRVIQQDAKRLAFTVDWAAVVRPSTASAADRSVEKFAHDLCERLVASPGEIIAFSFPSY